MPKKLSACVPEPLLLAILFLIAAAAPAENAPKHTYQTVRVADGIVAFIASESNTGIVSGNASPSSATMAFSSWTPPASLRTRVKSSPKSSK
jgi:hypothetical protein